MNLNNEPERLKEEEQLALNKLIAEMDEVINVLDEHMKTYVEEAKNIDILKKELKNAGLELK